MNDNFGITMKNEVISKGLEEIKEARKGLFEADENFYTAIIGIAQAVGYDQVLAEDLSIDMTKPEQVIEGCRTDMDNLISNLQSNIDIVNKLNSDSTTNKDELVETAKNNINNEPTSSVDEALTETPKFQFKQDNQADIINEVQREGQVLYGPPPTSAPLDPFQNPGMPEYESIPDTGIAGKSFGNGLASTLGTAAGIAGILGAATLGAKKAKEDKEKDN